MLEVGDIDRFPAVGNYSSYCRCVKSERISNSKKKGKGNQKNGNKYLIRDEPVDFEVVDVYIKNIYDKKG